MKRLIFFLVGVFCVVAAGWLVRSKVDESKSLVVARIRLEQPGATLKQQRELVAAEAVRIVSPAILRGAIRRGNLQQLPSFKNGDVQVILESNLTAERWDSTT